MATTTTHTCDICGKPAAHLQKNIQMVFTTEQTEGRPTTPHLSNQTMDLCDGCMQQIISRHPLRAAGAQGHNRYELLS